MGKDRLGTLLGIQRNHWDASSSPSGRLGASVYYHCRPREASVCGSRNPHPTPIPAAIPPMRPQLPGVQSLHGAVGFSMLRKAGRWVDHLDFLLVIFRDVGHNGQLRAEGNRAKRLRFCAPWQLRTHWGYPGLVEGPTGFHESEPPHCSPETRVLCRM